MGKPQENGGLQILPSGKRTKNYGKWVDDYGNILYYILWQFNRAIENDQQLEFNDLKIDLPSGPPVIKTWLAGKYTIQFDDFPIETPILSGFPIATFDDWRVSQMLHGAGILANKWSIMVWVLYIIYIYWLEASNIFLLIHPDIFSIMTIG